MAKRTASATSRTESSLTALNDHLSQQAQQELAALRRALESRLISLEEVLKDPGRGESMAGLILDLSRIATEEAQLAAAQACIATKADADKEIATVRASAKAALEAAQALKTTQASLDQERIVSADLRRTVDQAQLENRKQVDLLKARDQLEAGLRTDRERLEAEVAKQQSIVADLQRAAGVLQRAAADAKQQAETERRSSADWQAQLEAERASGVELRQFAESAAARLTTLEREIVDERAAREAAATDLTNAQTAHETMSADLARERQAASDRDRGRAQLQSQLDAERATVAQLQQAVRAGELSATLGRDASSAQKADEEAAFLQKSLAEARQALAAAQAELESQRASMAELRQAAEYTDQQLASARSNEAQTVADHQKVVAQLDAVIKEREAITDELAAARKWINQLREAEAEFALPPPPPHVETPPAPTPPAKTKGKTPAPISSSKPKEIEPEEGWEAVRLATRYEFNKELMVQVNGDPARLFDISTSGCQLLSPTALKPNQMVKIVLPHNPPVTCPGKVVWTRLEPMAMGQPLGYRAGVRFTKVDEPAIESFAARNATPA